MKRLMRLILNFCTSTSKKRKNYNFDYYKDKEGSTTSSSYKEF